jgi:hypothetical protein
MFGAVFLNEEMCIKMSCLIEWQQTWLKNPYCW